MHSDKHFFQIFEACPEYLSLLLGAFEGEPIEFSSRTFKKVERQADGVARIDGTEKRNLVVEFEMNKSIDIYNRLIMTMSLLVSAEPDLPVSGVLIFPTRSQDPGHRTWGLLRNGCEELVRVLYLDEEARKLEPDLPLAAVLAPFLSEDLDDLKTKAGSLAHTIRNAPIGEEQRRNLEEVFVSWMTAKFTNLTAKEVIEMIGVLTPLEETVSGKELIVKGEFNGQRKLLKSLFEEGVFSKAQYEQRLKNLKP